MKKTIITLWLIFMAVVAQSQPFIHQLYLGQVSVDGTVLTINYWVIHPVDSPAFVTFRAGPEGSSKLDFDTSNATGDIGPSINPQGGMHTIKWDFSAYGQQDFRIQLIATKQFSEVDIQDLVELVSEDSLITYMNAIEGVRHRDSNPAHLQATKDYILSKFEDANLQTSLHSFDYGGYQADNIIGKKFGISDETQVYIIDGHFDTVVDAPGADDNGSAVVGMLEAMRILSQFEFQKSIKFIGFDLEEAGVGLVGSKRYVDEQLLPPEETVGVINLEMIGYYTEEPNTQSVPGGFSTLFPDAYAALEADQFRGNFIINSSYQNSLPLAQAFNQAAAQYVPDLKV